MSREARFSSPLTCRVAQAGRSASFASRLDSGAAWRPASAKGLMRIKRTTAHHFHAHGADPGSYLRLSEPGLGVTPPGRLNQIAAQYQAHVTAAMGWAAWNLEGSQWSVPTYHLFLTGQGMSVCRRIRAEQARTPFFEFVPPDGQACVQCVRDSERTPVTQRTSENPAAIEVPLFARRSNRIRVRQL